MKIENNVWRSAIYPDKFEDLEQYKDVSELPTKRLTEVYEEVKAFFKDLCIMFIAIPILLAIAFGCMFIPVIGVFWLLIFLVGTFLSPFVAVGLFACICDCFVDMMDCKIELDSRKEITNESNITKCTNS